MNWYLVLDKYEPPSFFLPTFLLHENLVWGCHVYSVEPEIEIYVFLSCTCALRPHLWSFLIRVENVKTGVNIQSAFVLTGSNQWNSVKLLRVVNHWHCYHIKTFNYLNIGIRSPILTLCLILSTWYRNVECSFKEKHLLALIFGLKLQGEKSAEKSRSLPRRSSNYGAERFLLIHIK